VVEKIPPSVFFPAGSGRKANLAAARAIEICRRCPVSRLCYDDAQYRGTEHGVFGGRDWTRAAAGGVRLREMQDAAMRELWAAGVGMEGVAVVTPLRRRGAA
jgi:hypothetical protein